MKPGMWLVQLIGFMALVVIGAIESAGGAISPADKIYAGVIGIAFCAWRLGRAWRNGTLDSL